MKNGIDHIENVRALLRGKRVGLITNPTGVDGGLQATADILQAQIACFFGPEHGIRGMVQDELHVAHGTDPVTGLPEYSLFGDVLAPTAAMLDGLDTLVFDIQDIGVRFYTYTTTMALSMEQAALHGKAFVVLDRANPLGRAVQGQLPQEGFGSFLSYLPVPTRHGLTAGEIATMWQRTRFPGLELHVVTCTGWRPQYPLHDGDLSAPWVPPSPNMPTRQCTWVYPGTCLVEGTSVSEGRGTTKPFEQVGAPWLDARRLAAALNARGLPGVLFRPCHFTPVEFKHKNIPCQGVQVHVTHPKQLNSVEMGVHLIDELREQSGEHFTWRYLPEYKHYMTDLLHGGDSLRIGTPLPDIFARMARDAAAFAEQAQEWKLYKS